MRLDKTEPNPHQEKQLLVRVGFILLSLLLLGMFVLLTVYV